MLSTNSSVPQSALKAVSRAIDTRIQREDAEKDGELGVPVACLADMDVMPDCAPTIVGKKMKEDGTWPDRDHRRWLARRDFTEEGALQTRRDDKVTKASGQNINTFVSDEWTLEYDLALGPRDGQGAFTSGLAEDVFVAACLADSDDKINAGTTNSATVETAALGELGELKASAAAKDGSSYEEVLASHVYARFAKDGVSKAVAAQYLAQRLERKHDDEELSTEHLRARLPKYIVDAIDHVTGAGLAANPPAEGADE